ncbi:glycosyltransferase family 2 protein [Cellulomonas sp. zg-ZUI199]|uniref:Glycosyltransferase family 2 protein n=1 Tax=Cellulomonas wangleii TaxID=2816956 RepID=A0ABX8D2D4_9CELL|nr:glycosyltransferase family 2 protein [Cellulomonas wangleii]MBO0925300.1 glycosyltransferase family 2 protein [Cellulomonas wangleii]QVI61201.1 glycosyltransferase family 2 protein [Cellulomonas wangleii]
MPTPEDLLVVLPAWNEEITLPAVLGELRDAMPGTAVLVVSDGSTDRTAAVAREAGAAVLDLPINLGVGGAMRAGFKYALANGYRHVVQVDADGQHDPTEIPRLVEVAVAERADVVIGARFAGAGAYQARGPRRWAMRVLSTTLSRLVGTRLTDTTSGFKLSGPRAVALFAAEYPAEYLGDTIESLVIAHRAGLVVRQAPVVMRPRAGGAPSHSPWRAGVFLARAGLALAVALSRPAPRPVRAVA